MVANVGPFSLGHMYWPPGVEISHGAVGLLTMDVARLYFTALLGALCFGGLRPVGPASGGGGAFPICADCRLYGGSASIRGLQQILE